MKISRRPDEFKRRPGDGKGCKDTKHAQVKKKKKKQVR